MTKPAIWFNPYIPQRKIGTTNSINAVAAHVNLPCAADRDGQMFHGHRVPGGELGEFVFFECGEFALLGKIVELVLPERERLSVEQELNRKAECNPFGIAQFLASVDVTSGTVQRGIVRYPRVGAHVFSAHPSLVKHIIEGQQGNGANILLELASLSDSATTSIRISPESLFGRHCAILGATGGGKSWTIARLLEEIGRAGGKAILLDATGEFYQLPGLHIHVGNGGDPAPGSREAVFPYTDLREQDLLAIFRPAPQVQAPKLRAAIESLKLAHLEPHLADNGSLIKAQKKKLTIERALHRHIATISAPGAEWDIKKLTKQIVNECVWPNGFQEGRARVADHTVWGDAHEGDFGQCISLINRVRDILESTHFDCIFKPEGKQGISAKIDEFLTSDDAILRMSLQNIPFDYHARELLVNAVGRYLLKMAREGRFREQPIVVFLDEAHQFLNKRIGDEHYGLVLDAFNLIGKEGRKYGLTMAIATQRPRDIPEDVLSQVGAMLVHRLANHQDRDVVERSSGDIDRSAAAFLPTLRQGEALLFGVDFPMPLTIKVSKPGYQPISKGPDYQSFWGEAREGRRKLGWIKELSDLSDAQVEERTGTK